MKVLVILISFFFTDIVSSQGNSKVIVQKERYEYGVKLIAENKIEKGMGFLRIAHNLLPESEIGITSRKKFDSIKPIYRQQLLNDIKGSWKLVKSGTNWGYQNTNSTEGIEYVLQITNDELRFYKKNIKTNSLSILNVEKILFNEPVGMYSGFTEITFSDNQIWKLELKKSTDILHSVNTGRATENSRTIVSCGNSENYYERVED